MLKHVFLWTMAAWMLCMGVAEAQWMWTPQTGRWVNTKRLPRETPELQVEYARSLMVEGDHKKALRETNKFNTFYAESELADENQFLRGEIKMAQGDLKGASKEYQLLLSAFPDTDLFDKAIAKQYEIGDYYYDRAQRRMKKWFRPFKLRPLRRAIDVYALVIESQPFTAEAAEAQYKLGLCHFTREEYLEAAFEYRRVLEDYPGSDWVDEAGHALAICYYDAALPADYDQTPSMLAIQAMDHFQERFPEDDRMNELLPKRQEMRDSIAEQKVETAKFYLRRRDFTAARLCYSVVAEEYADTAWADNAKQWLSNNPETESAAQAKLRQLRGEAS
jgi:outer membrane assembly lipoprotein YfiO